MYWVTGKVLPEVLRNPNNHGEPIKQRKASQIFQQIKESYQAEFPNTWNKRSVPLEFFVEEYCKTTGENYSDVKEQFDQYFLQKN